MQRNATANVMHDTLQHNTSEPHPSSNGQFGCYSACTDPALAGLALAPPTCLFASSMQDGGAHYAGVTSIQLRALPGLSVHPAPFGAHPSCRPLHCIVVWDGHRLSLVNTYWPIGCTSGSAQWNYRDQAVLPHLPHCLRASLLLVRDFNNVPDAAAGPNWGQQVSAGGGGWSR
jgi:hypothetical protein